MHVTKLKAQNVKKLKTVDVQFDEDEAVVIKGKNAAGKSSILDAIWFALGGARTFSDQEVIREGEEKAKATVEVGDFIVERRWTEKNTSLKVMDKEGRQYSSPQSMLDEFAEVFAYDPLEFLRLHPSEQKAKLLEITGHKDKLEELETERERVYGERRDLNRQVKKAEGALEEQFADVDVEHADEDLPSTSELVNELEEAKALRDRKQEREENAQARREKAEEMREQAKALMEKADEFEASAEEMEEEAEGIEVPDIDALKERVEKADEVRALVEAAREKKELLEARDEVKQQSEELTQRLDEIEEEKENVLASADLPSGIGFGEDGVTLDGRPLEQASMSEKLRTVVQLAMHMKPKLKIIQVRDGSLLDNDSQEELKSIAKEAGFQVFIEMVGTDGDASILIEDGEVVG